MDASWELPEHEDFYNFQQMGEVFFISITVVIPAIDFIKY